MENQVISENKENAILIDWLSVTFHDIHVDDVKRLLGLGDSDIDWNDRLAFRHGYPRQCSFAGIVIRYGADDSSNYTDDSDKLAVDKVRFDMGIMLDMSGSACRAFETYGHGDWLRLLGDICNLNTRINFTRLDLAFDDHTGILDIGRIRSDIENRYYTGSPKKAHLHWSDDQLKDLQGLTLYIGSEKSPVFIRIYDKAVERDYGSDLHWVRVELVLRKERATAAIAEILQRHNVGETIATLSSSINKVTREDCKHYDTKLASSLSRTRKLLLEKALCNPWDWFCTFTLDKSKYKRDDLPKFHKDFTQFIRDERKRGFPLSFLLVPELHEDLQNWHIHGFLYGDPGLVSFKEWRRLGHKIPSKLISGGFYTWPRYQDKFGFCSLGRIKSHVRSAFYISKYMSKNNARLVSSLGSNMYYCSQGLNTAVKHGEIYGHSAYMDKFLERDYEFCQVGMTKLSDRCDWTFGLDFMDIPLDVFEPVFEEIKPSRGFWDDMSALQWEQLNLYDTAPDRS